jgi:hypothetical protein
MFDFLKTVRHLKALKDGIAAKSIDDIQKAAGELATIFGYGNESEALNAIIDAAQLGDYVDVLNTLGHFLQVLAKSIVGPVSFRGKVVDNEFIPEPKNDPLDGARLTCVQECFAMQDDVEAQLAELAE